MQVDRIGLLADVHGTYNHVPELRGVDGLSPSFCLLDRSGNEFKTPDTD